MIIIIDNSSDGKTTGEHKEHSSKPSSNEGTTWMHGQVITEKHIEYLADIFFFYVDTSA